MQRTSRILVLVLFPLLLLLGACQIQLYADLEEEQANVMLALLLSYGIRAEKQAAGKGLFLLSVEESQVVRAIRLLHEHSLPRDRFATMGSVFSASGMISSKAEEQARLMWALSQELSNTFSRVDGVLNSRVHVVLGVNDPVNNVKISPSATVFIRHTPDSIVTTLVAEIRRATAGAVAGLSPDNVNVMLVPFRMPVTLPNAAPPPPSLIGQHFSLPLLLQTVALALVFAAAGLGGAYFVTKKRAKKKQKEGEAQET
ncbi:MAG: type III secretion inner membrane ring lipoprotein SctJ [Desulfovibrionaceae bacterium]|nr:type III secretion inner membrane ring lipoprotein SctJ [Desulfovibrionaceae bacterium]